MASGSRPVAQPSPLVAVLLITATSSRAPQVLFRYPRKPRPIRRYSKVRYYASQEADWPPHPSQSSHTSASATPHRRSQDAHHQPNGNGFPSRWHDQDEESEGTSFSSQDTSSDNESYSLSDDQSASFSDSARDSPAEASDDSDIESVSEAFSNSRTAPSATASRKSRKDVDASNANIISSRVPTSSSRGSTHRRRRSPSVAHMSSSFRDPTAEHSLERRSQNGESGIKSRRRGLTLTATEQRPQRRRRDQRKNDMDRSPSRKAKNAKAFSHYLGFPIEDLAEYLAPDRDLCNRRFDFTVDDLTFIGHPVRMHSSSQETQTADLTSHQDERGRRGRSGQDLEGALPGSTRATSATSAATPTAPPVTFLHLVLVVQSPDPSYAALSLDLTTWLGFWYDSICLKMTAALFAEEQRCTYVSQESHLLSKLWGEVEGNSGSGPSYALHLSRVLLTSSLARCLRDLYRCISRPSPHRTPYVTVNNLDVHPQLPPLLVDPVRMGKSITELGPSIDAVNAEMKAEEEGGGGGINEPVRGMGTALDEWTKASGPPLFPWKTLLLLSDPDEEEVTKTKRYRSLGGQVVELPSDDESSLDEPEGADLADAGIELYAKKFTALLKPTVSGGLNFSELSEVLGWDLEEDVYPMARHLVYYKQARVVDVPMVQNTYGLSPLFDMTNIHKFLTSFALRFPEQAPLPRLLAALGSSFQPFYNHWLRTQAIDVASHAEPHKDPTKRQAAFDALIWLLRHEVIIQQHLRFRLIATEGVKRKARQMWEEQRATRDEALRRREELREWKRERRALQRGADPTRREGELVPLLAQSAPDRSDLYGETVSAAPADEGDRGRAPRQRSRSAEARDRSKAQSTNDPVAASNAASRVSSSSSRSRSRNPLPLGRISAFGRLTSAAGGAGVYTPEDGYRRGPEGLEPGLEFERRPVQRSRSPSSNQPGIMNNSMVNLPPPMRPQLRDGSSGSSAAALLTTGSIPREGAAPFLVEQHRRRALSMVRGPTSASSGSGDAIHNSSPLSEVHQLGSGTATAVGVGRGRPWGESSVSASGSALPSHMAAQHQRKVSRSPSQARMRVRGFGEEEEVWIDGEEVKADEVEEAPVGPQPDEARRLSNVGEESPERQTALVEASLVALDDKTEASRTASAKDGEELPRTTLQDSLHESVYSRHAKFSLQPELCGENGDGNQASSSRSSNSDEDDDDDEDLVHLNNLYIKDDFPEPSYDFTPSLISVPNRASREESAWIHAMLDGKDADVSDAFRRLTPYLDGRHTIDEALADPELQMGRRDLRNLLNRFREDILTFVHP